MVALAPIRLFLSASAPSFLSNFPFLLSCKQEDIHGL